MATAVLLVSPASGLLEPLLHALLGEVVPAWTISSVTSPKNCLQPKPIFLPVNSTRFHLSSWGSTYHSASCCGHWKSIVTQQRTSSQANRIKEHRSQPLCWCAQAVRTKYHGLVVITTDMWFLPIPGGGRASFSGSFLGLQKPTLFLNDHTAIPVCLCPDPLFEWRQQLRWTEDCVHTLILTNWPL